MKRIIALLLVAVMLFSFAACGETAIPQNAFTKEAYQNGTETPLPDKAAQITNITGTYKESNGVYHFVVKFKLPEVPTDWNVHLNRDIDALNIKCSAQNGYVELEFDGRNPSVWSQYISIACASKEFCYCVFVDIVKAGII